MGAPVPNMNAVEDSTAETLLSSLRTIEAGERRKHASVYNYWLSIRTDREFPPIRDLDPLEISDAGPFSILLEMIGGGEDAEIRHFGSAVRKGIDAQKVSDAPNPSLLSCVAKRLPVVAATRDAFAFEDQFETADGKIRCWVTLLPFSATGTWIDYVYGFVSLGDGAAAAETAPEASAEAEPMRGLSEVLELADKLADTDNEPVEPEAVEPEAVEPEPEPAAEIVEAEPVEEPAKVVEAEPQPDQVEEALEAEPQAGEADEATAPIKPTFSTRFFETLANVGGLYGRPVEVELDMETASLESWEAEEPASAQELPSPEEPALAQESPSPEEPPSVEEPEPPVEVSSVAPPEEPPAIEDEPAPPEQPSSQSKSKPTSEGPLHIKLEDVRAKADEARQAKLRANTALYEGLSAAYDFALDAECSPEEYLKLVEAQGIKIQLRSPMKPVAKLAFDGMCDDATIKQLEAILAWAFEEELPRGTLAERIEAEGGIGPILSGERRAA